MDESSKSPEVKPEESKVDSEKSEYVYFAGKPKEESKEPNVFSDVDNDKVEVEEKENKSDDKDRENYV